MKKLLIVLSIVSLFIVHISCEKERLEDDATDQQETQDTLGNQEGNIAPDFTSRDQDSTLKSLSDFKGKYVYLEFWAAWCSPCRSENVHTLATYRKFKDENFTILQVSYDKTKEAWLTGIEEDTLGAWHHMSDVNYWDTETQSLYNVRAIPYGFLISPEGKILKRDIRYPQLDSVLTDIFNSTTLH